MGGLSCMKIERYLLGMFQTNCYIIENEALQESIIVDPAIAPLELTEAINKSGITPKAILLTHGHLDHIMGVKELVQAYNIPVYAYSKEKQLLENPEMNLSAKQGEEFTYYDALYVEHEEYLQLAGFDVKVIATPGHTVGGCCYYIEKEHVLFSGDTLFLGTVGRSDLPTGDGKLLIRSIKETILKLPEDTVVYPGHGEATTIGKEKNENPYL